MKIIVVSHPTSRAVDFLGLILLQKRERNSGEEL